jgi:hypothetical protein
MEIKKAVAPGVGNPGGKRQVPQQRLSCIWQVWERIPHWHPSSKWFSIAQGRQYRVASNKYQCVGTTLTQVDSSNGVVSVRGDNGLLAAHLMMDEEHDQTI